MSPAYERRSLMSTANQPFGGWDQIFPDTAMTVAAIDRLVHHSVILEMNVESYRRRTTLTRVAVTNDTVMSPDAVAPATSSPTPE